MVLHTFLKSIRLWFESCTKTDRFTVLISILGVILTTASVVASVAQYRAADLQAQAAVVALMPQIEVRALLEKVDSDKFTDRRIEIFSDGGPIYNLRVEHLTWIEFRINGKSALEEPLNGYYFAAYPTGRIHGPVYTLKGYKNNEIYFEFQHWARSALFSGVEIGEPITLLRIQYRDAMKHDCIEFIQIRGGTELHLEQREGELLWITQSDKRIGKRLADINDLLTPAKGEEWIKSWSVALQKAVAGG